MDPHLANMIAAGEVVERPAGIVKELVENALDANASDISVTVTEGGMDTIKVVDNGDGMDAEDLKNAFKRHSTSKIYDPEDLNHIRSFGFRGEALPSIASVSIVRVDSHNGTEGHQIIINNSTQESFGRIARNKGTTLEVKELFSRVPARLKYIKNPRYESSIILDTIQKFSAAHPDVSFSYTTDGKESYRSYGNSSLKDVFYRIFGSEVSTNAIELEAEDYDYKITGVFAQPEHTRSNKTSIWLYINNRMIRSSRLQNAVVEGYRRHIPKDRFPIGILKIEVDPQLVDVNVHPSKWEIRLSKEKELISLIIDTLENQLSKKYRAPRIEVQPEIQETIIEELLEAQSKAYQTQIPTPIYEEVFEKPAFVQEQQVESKAEVIMPSLKQEPVIEVPESQLEPLIVLAQMSGKYILAQGEEGLYIIDQHAAMERVRYEYFQSKLLDKESVIQPLLFPLILEGRSALVMREEEVIEAFKGLNINIEVLDQDSFVIREHPTWLKENELKEFADKTLDYLESHKTVREEDFRSNSLATLACHSSVRFNEYLSMEEMQALVESLRKCSNPNHCPHGRPTYMVVDHKMLWKGFMR